MIVQLDDIFNNPFRILGLDVSASSREVTRASDDLCAAIHVGASNLNIDILSLAEPLNKSEDMVIQARHSLQDTFKRPVYEFFWFWFGYPYSKNVQNALLEGDLDKAISMHDTEIEMGNAETVLKASHDLGLLLLITTSLAKKNDNVCKNYKRALELLLTSTSKHSQDPSITQLIHKKTLNIVAEQVHCLVDLGEIYSACALYNVLLDCSYDDYLRKTACSLPFKAYFESKITLCEEMKHKVDTQKFDFNNKTTREFFLAICTNFKRDIVSPIDKITDRCKFYYYDIEPICNAIMDYGSHLSILLHNELKDSKYALDILQSIERLPASESKVQRIQEGIQIIRDYIQEDKYPKNWNETKTDADDSQTLMDEVTKCEMTARLGGKVTPVVSNPYLFTMNGWGCKFWGNTNQGNDGSYITTHWFVIFFLPIIALSRYLVKPAPKAGWHILGKLPLLRWQIYYSLAAVLAIMSIAVVICMNTNFNDSGYVSPSQTQSQNQNYDNSSTSDQSSSSEGNNKETATPSNASSENDTSSDISIDTQTSDYTPIEDHSIEIESIRSFISNADQQLETWQEQLDTWRSEMNQIKSDIQSLKSEKESIEQDSELGETIDEERYHSLIAEANTLVDNYNSMKNQHNILVRKHNALVNNRNAKLKHLKALEEEN